MLFDSDFALGGSAGWPTGNGGFFNTQVTGGRYTLSVQVGHLRVQTPTQMTDLSDGQVSAEFRLEGQGRVGLVARMNATASTGYAFWIDDIGDVGAERFADGDMRTLFVLHSGIVNAGGDNALALRVQGKRVDFTLNSRQIFTVGDRVALPAGTWGVFAQGGLGHGLVQGHFARITISGDALTGVPPSLTPGPFTPMIDYSFSLGNNHSWGTGILMHSNAEIDHGRYNVSVRDGFTRTATPLQFPQTADGQIGAVLNMEGQGRVGVMGRWSVDNPGGWSLYACWIDDRGDVGLSRQYHEQRITLVTMHDARVDARQDTTVVLRVQSDHISCFVNGARVARYVDPHPLPAGIWGAWVSDYPGGPSVQGHYARILIAR
jgi:hypothetical protein